MRHLRSGYAEMAEPVLRARNEAVNLERKLSVLVNGAYGLTDEESNLLFARPLRLRTPYHSFLRRLAHTQSGRSLLDGGAGRLPQWIPACAGMTPCWEGVGVPSPKVYTLRK